MGLIKIFKENKKLKQDLYFQQVENSNKQDKIRKLKKEIKELKEEIESGRKKNRTRSNTRK